MAVRLLAALLSGCWREKDQSATDSRPRDKSYCRKPPLFEQQPRHPNSSKAGIQRDRPAVFRESTRLAIHRRGGNSGENRNLIVPRIGSKRALERIKHRYLWSKT